MKKATKTTKAVKSVKEVKAVKSSKKVVAKVAPEVVVETVPETVVKTPTKMSPLMGVVLGGLILVAAGLYGYDRFGSIAVVNGSPISRLDYYKTMEKQVGKQTIDNMVLESLILGAATKSNFTVAQADIDAELSTIETSLKAQGKTLDEALTQEGMEKKDLERQIRIQKIVETLSKKEASISATAIDTFLTTNKEQLPKDATPEELKKMAEEELMSQAASENMRTWVEDLKATAKIIYK